MKYGLEHMITKDIGFITRSPLESASWFAAYLIQHVPKGQQYSERKMWKLLDLPYKKPERLHMITSKEYTLAINIINRGLGMLPRAVTLYELT